MDCPRCKGSLQEASYEGFPVFRCSDCGGFWVNGDVLLDIINKREARIPEAAIAVARGWQKRHLPKRELDSELECPVCGSALERSVYGYDTGIVIDRCPSGCGIWLDAGELVALQAFDEVWDKKARDIFEEKGLRKIFDTSKEEDPETAVIRKAFFGRSIVGRLADIFVDFLD